MAGTRPEADDQTPEPQLLPPQPLALRPPAIASAGVLLVLGVGAAALWWMAAPPANGGKTPSSALPPTISMPADRVAGAVIQVSGNGYSNAMLAKLQVSTEERDRLRKALGDGRLRIGMIKLWDTMVEDGDRVRLEGAGFVQELTILHKAAVFLVPYVPGQAVRITAIGDGGGGVTLGLSTILGPVVLPPLALGQTLEIPVL